MRSRLAALAALLALAALAALSSHGPAAAQTASVLVSNTGLTATSTSSIQHDLAQDFTTGSHTAGYRLTKVQFRLRKTTTAEPVYTVTVHDTSSSPSLVGTLTNPSSLPHATAAIVDFTAPGGGIDLKPNTLYRVVWDVSDQNSSTGALDTVLANAEDANPAVGWSIDDRGLFRDFDSTTWTASINSRQIAIHGFAKDLTVPTVSSAAANGTTLTITFSENLDASSVPASSAFTLFSALDGQGPVQIGGTGTVTIADATVTVPLDSTVEWGATLTLVYTAPATNPLQDASGNAVADFRGQAVTNNAGTLFDVMDGCTAAACPDAPTGSAVPGPDPGEITVTWAVAATGGTPASWQVKHTPAGGSSTTTSINDASRRTHTFTGLDPTKLYDIVVQGIGAGSTFGDAAVAKGVRPVETTPPTVVGAITDGTRLAVTFSEQISFTPGTPPESAFTVSATRGGTTRTITVSSVTIGNNSETSQGYAVLTLAEAVLSIDTVTVGYTRPSSGAIEDEAGNQLATFTGQVVTNNTPADTTAPTVSRATVNGTRLVLNFNEQLLVTSSPASSAFTVSATLGGSTRTITVSGHTIVNDSQTAMGAVVLTLAEAVLNGQTVTVSYSKPTSGSVLQDASGNEVAGFSSQTVTNNTPDTTPPTALSAVNITGQTTVVITFNENLDTASIPPPGRFQVIRISGGFTNILRNGTAVAMSAARATVTFPEVAATATHVQYTQPSTGNQLKDPAGNIVTFFSVALTIQAGNPPTVDSAEVDGDSLLVTFSEGNLQGFANRLDWRYKVDGVDQGNPSSTSTDHVLGTVVITLNEAVTSDQVVLLSYTQRTTNPLRSDANVAIESFTDLTVTNNTPESDDDDDRVGVVPEYEPLPLCTEEQANRRQRPGEWPPPDCRGGFFHPWDIPSHLISDPCDQPWQVPGSYRHDRGCLNRY